MKRPSRILVSHRTEDGSADATFGRNGLQAYRITQAHGHNYIDQVVPLASGGVQIAGVVVRSRDSHAFHFMLRLRADGSYDSTLAGVGQLHRRVFRISDSAALIGADGSWMFAHVTESRRLRVTRYTATGALDPTYGAKGAAVVRPLEGWRFESTGLIGLAPDGGLLIATSAAFPGPETVVVKLTPGGALDTGYGQAGLAIAPAEWGRVGPGGAIGSDGRMVLICITDEQVTYPCVAMMAPDGTPDSAFGDGGRAVIHSDQIGPNVYWVRGATDESGAVYLAGSASTAPFLLRLSSDGALDQTFGDGGVVTGYTRTQATIGSLVRDDAGRLLVTAGGSVMQGDGGEIVRFLAQ